MILIACRSNSSRFPMKHLSPLAGSTVLDILISRVQETLLPFTFLIPTGDILKEELRKRGVGYFEGPEEDVLKRYALAADRYKLEWCIRITGDCPLISTQDIFWMARMGILHKVDYGSNLEPVQTDGQEIEFISRRLLDKAHSEVTSAEDREHVTPWMRRNGASLMEQGFRYYLAPIQYGWHGAGKLSIDTLEDLERVERVMRLMNGA